VVLLGLQFKPPFFCICCMPEGRSVNMTRCIKCGEWYQKPAPTSLKQFFQLQDPWSCETVNRCDCSMQTHMMKVCSLLYMKPHARCPFPAGSLFPSTVWASGCLLLRKGFCSVFEMQVARMSNSSIVAICYTNNPINYC